MNAEEIGRLIDQLAIGIRRYVASLLRQSAERVQPKPQPKPEKRLQITNVVWQSGPPPVQHHGRRKPSHVWKVK